MSSQSPEPDAKLFLKIAVKNALLTRQQAQVILNKTRPDTEPSDIAIQEGWLAPDQVERIERAIMGARVARIDQLYARFVERRGWVIRGHLLRALEIQRQRGFQVRLGELLVTAQLLSMEQHTTVLKDVLAYLSSQEQALEGAQNAPAQGRPESPAIATKRGPSSLGRPSEAVKAKPVLEFTDSDDDEPKAETRADPQSDTRGDGWHRRTQVDDGYITALKPEQARKHDPLAATASVVENSATSESQRQFLASAIAIAISDDNDADSTLSVHDRELLEGDVKVAEDLTKSGVDGFRKLDDVKLSAASGDLFKPEEYIARRRRGVLKVRLAIAAAGVLLLAVLVVMLLSWRNSSVFGALKTRLEEAKTLPSMNARFNAYRALLRDLEALGGLGPDERQRAEFRGLIQRQLLETGVRSALESGDPNRAREALNAGRAQRYKELQGGQKPERLGYGLALLDKLEREIDLEATLQRGRKFAKEGRSSQALGAFRRARQLAPDRDKRPQEALEALKKALIEREAELRKSVEAGSERDLESWRQARKELLELFPGLALVGGQKDLTPNERDGRALVVEGNLLAKRGELEKALDAWREALRLIPSVELAWRITTLRRNLRGLQCFASGDSFFKSKDYKRALEMYLRARPLLKEESKVEDLNKRIRRCREALQ